MSASFTPTKCGFCGKDSPNLKSCPKCHLTPYCSGECQRKDWKRHQQWCELLQGNTPAEDKDPITGAQNQFTQDHPVQEKKKRRRKKKSGQTGKESGSVETCTWCSKVVVDVLRCSRCKVIIYCSETCRGKDWTAGHKTVCEPRSEERPSAALEGEVESLDTHVQGEENDHEDIGSNICDWCQKYVDLPLRCKGCNKVTYCSEVCQKKDWDREHRNKCERKKPMPDKEYSTDGPSKTEDDEQEFSDVCDWCKKFLDSPLRCSGCGKATYCSETCQKKDWTRQHKTKCDKSKVNKKKKSSNGAKSNEKDLSETDESESTPVNCNWCQKFVEDVVHCGGCTKVIYCSVGCQQKDWHLEHQRLCEGKENGKNKRNMDSNFDMPSESDSEASTKDRCGSCKKKTKDMKKCARCKIVLYCSKSCQRQDWPRHKEECVTVDGVIKTKEYRKAEHAAQSEPERPMSRLEMMAQMMGLFGGIQPEARPRMSWEEAKRITKLRHPGFSIVENFENLPGEFLWMVPVTYNKVLLAYITRQHPHFVRHAVYIRDSLGQETFVMFYLNFDNPRPFFSWSQVAPGNYICIRNAVLHGFLDGTVGIRVDDAADVTIL